MEGNLTVDLDESDEPWLDRCIAILDRLPQSGFVHTDQAAWDIERLANMLRAVKDSGR